MTRRSAWQLLGILVLASMLSGCRHATPPPPEEPLRLGKLDAAGLHNVYRLTEKLFSGSSPEGDEGFASLKRLGIKTVLTVDGARPDIARAQRFGLRYVHLPIGYDGVPMLQGRRIAKAVRDLPGPVYVHCHHGKHRAPAAVAVVRLCLDPACRVETAVQEMRRAGTAPDYVGLYAAPQRLHRPTVADLDALSDEFPEVVEVGGLAGLMVQIDERWDRLGLARAAHWKTLPSHPDLDPPHEALLLSEGYQEALRLPAGPNGSEELRRLLSEALGAANGLQAALRAGQGEEDAYTRVAASCTACHAKYRDQPR